MRDICRDRELDVLEKLINDLGKLFLLIIKQSCDMPNILELRKLLDRDPDALSGGELQRFAIAVSCVRVADIYMFDEPSSYLDVRQRLEAARVIRELSNESK